GTMVSTAELSSRVLEGAKTALAEVVRKHEGSGVPLRGLVAEGETWRALLATAEDVKAGLIVMGTHGRRGLPRALLGSVAEKVVRMASCPVLTVQGSPHAKEPADEG